MLFPDAMFPSTAIINGRVEMLVEMEEEEGVLVDREEGEVMSVVGEEMAVSSQDQRSESSILVFVLLLIFGLEMESAWYVWL